MTMVSQRLGLWGPSWFLEMDTLFLDNWGFAAGAFSVASRLADIVLRRYSVGEVLCYQQNVAAGSLCWRLIPSLPRWSVRRSRPIMFATSDGG